MLILVFVHYVLALVFGLTICYTFQIKEYRFDRFKSMIKEIGVFRFLYSFKIHFPGITLRNILILLAHFMITSLVFLYSIEQIHLFTFLGRTFFLAPFTALGAISVGVLITNIPSSLIRSWIRRSAKIRVQKSKAVFIGITGSYGKTSTKEYLAHILSAQYEVAKTPKNMNTDVGIALSINRSLTANTQYFITELGAYRTGELNHAASYIPFQYIILCGLGNQHLDLYGSKQALIKEETSPIFNLSPNGKAYLNIDSIKENNIDLSSVPSVTYGSQKEADMRLIDIHTSSNGTRGTALYKNQHFQINTSLLGAHSLENILPAIAIAYDLGMDKELIEKQIRSIQPLKGKLSIHLGPSRSTILHDGVNTNLNGFLAAIDVMNLFNHKKKMIMTQGIIELGGEKRSSYKSILNSMGGKNISLFTTDRLFNTIKSSVQINTFNDVDSMKAAVVKELNQNSLLLIEGAFAQPILTTFFSSESISNTNK